MKILLLTSIYPPDSGGPAIFTSQFSKWLSDQQILTEVITYSFQMNSNKSISYVNLNSFRILAFTRFIIRIIQKTDKQTLILANGVFIETFIACVIKRCKFVAKVPGDLVWELSRNRGWTTKNIEDFQNEKLNIMQLGLRNLQNLSLRYAKHVIVPSNQLADLCQSWGVKSSNISVVYNSVNPRLFIKSDIKNKEYDLVTVCRLVPWKGLEELIDTVIKMNFSLAVVGAGPLLENLKLLSSSRNGRVVFFGNVENSQIVKILNHSKVFVLNSDYEATSYALIEAKMCGLPVLARETNGSTILVRDSVDGLIYSEKRTLSLEKVLSKTINNESWISDLGANARQDALIRFNQDINFKKIYDILVK
jgi:glycosyltransferase involved in cell wall biosynthesis